MRARNPICPRCGIRPKSKTYRQYCLECGREIGRQRDASKRGTVRGKKRKNLYCPLCGGEPLPNHIYCAECSALPQRIRDQRMAEKRDQEQQNRKHTMSFSALQAEAEQVNWLKCRARGIAVKPSKTPPPPKRKMEISDFISREGFNIGALGI